MKTYNKKEYKLYPKWTLLTIHWVLNPGVAINELFLGQRVPTKLYLDKNSKEPIAKKTYVKCPNCHTMHNGMIWSQKNAFGHWLGYICPNCHEQIPCLWNLTSLLILLITFPVWLPLLYIYKKRFINYEITRFKNEKHEFSTKITNNIWKITGALWSILFYIFFSLWIYFFQHERNISNYLNLIPITALGGIFFAISTKFCMRKFINKTK